MRRIDIDDPDVEIDFDHRLLHNGEPFTGEAEEYLAGHRVSLVTYTDGYKDGPFHEWYKSGNVRAEGTMRMGFVSGEFQRWHDNGVLAKRTINSEDGRTPLAEFEWDEEGRPTRSWQRTSS
ncbi:toxin-antitoxin system YwqK family antitoxin [Streptomyces sp. NPDC058231]|uniref:toxin-antitoxin system YwqK family antitoxin n=1 Tax=Streptomyces sp. NPDC058231 TaxID=3346392 RepID=UPI0036DFF9F7